MNKRLFLPASTAGLRPSQGLVLVVAWMVGWCLPKKGPMGRPPPTQSSKWNQAALCLVKRYFYKGHIRPSQEIWKRGRIKLPSSIP